MWKYGIVTLAGFLLAGGPAAAQPGATPPIGGAVPAAQPDPSAAGEPAIPDTPADPGAEPMGGPAPQPRQPPPGSTHVTFVSTSSLPWDITLDQQRVCTTPCALWVEPLRFVALHSHERRPVRLDVGYLGGGDVTIAAEPLHEGAYAAGITFTTLGGMAVVTGITLAAVGCSTDRGGMCTAGAITGISGGAVLAGSIWLMLRSVPRAHIGPAAASPYVAGNQIGLSGTF